MRTILLAIACVVCLGLVNTADAGLCGRPVASQVAKKLTAPIRVLSNLAGRRIEWRKTHQLGHRLTAAHIRGERIRCGR